MFGSTRRRAGCARSVTMLSPLLAGCPPIFESKTDAVTDDVRKADARTVDASKADASSVDTTKNDTHSDSAKPPRVVPMGTSLERARLTR